MTWTYTATPGTSDAAGRRDAVRLAIGDTDTTDQQVQDEEIAYWLSQSNDDVYAASVLACQALVAKFSRDVNSSVESIRVNAGDRVKHYRELAKELRTSSRTYGATKSLGTPLVGGVSESAVDTVEDDTDRVDPAFKSRMFGNPNSDTDQERNY